MSRGPGRIQRYLIGMIRWYGKPMTFADIRAQVKQDLDIEPDGKLRVSFERSLRRALHRFVCDEILISVGNGGPADPLQYLPHPLLIAFGGNKAEIQAASAVLTDAIAKATGADR